MIRRPPRSTLSSSSAASDVYKRQNYYLFHYNGGLILAFLYRVLMWMFTFPVLAHIRFQLLDKHLKISNNGVYSDPYIIAGIAYSIEDNLHFIELMLLL